MIWKYKAELEDRLKNHYREEVRKLNTMKEDVDEDNPHEVEALEFQKGKVQSVLDTAKALNLNLEI